MRAYKQFTTKDVTITNFEASKLFTLTGNQSTGSDVGIEYYLGECPPNNLIFISQSANWSGINYKEPNIGVYSNVKQLYYSNFISQSYGDLAITQSILPGADSEFQNQWPYGGIGAPRYDNFLQSTLTQSRYFPTESGDKVSVMSIPARMYGEHIMPTSFAFTYTSSTNAKYYVRDDGQGNLLTGSQIIGQIFYPHGITVFTSGGFVSMSSDITDNSTPTYPNLDNVTLSYSTSFTIYEHQYRCVINENEFSYTLNPTALGPLASLTTIPNNLVPSITTNTADAGIGIYTNTSQSSNISASGDLSPGSGAIFTLTTTGIDGLATVTGIQVTNRGHSYNIGDVITIDKDQFTGTTDLVVTLTQDNFYIEGKNTDIYHDFVTGSYFTPFITSIGLYNNDLELIAVGKLSSPTPISQFVDTNIYVNFDM